MKAILGNEVVAGDVVVIAMRDQRAARACRKCFYPTAT